MPAGAYCGFYCLWSCILTQSPGHLVQPLTQFTHSAVLTVLLLSRLTLEIVLLIASHVIAWHVCTYWQRRKQTTVKYTSARH
jgi:hypothetical protein